MQRRARPGQRDAARLVALARPGRDGPGLAAIRPPLRPGRRAVATAACARDLARPRGHPGGRAGRSPGAAGSAAPRQAGAGAGDVPGSARRRPAAAPARPRLADGRRAPQLDRGRAPGQPADRGADAQPQRLGPRRAARRAARGGLRSPAATTPAAAARRTGQANGHHNGHVRLPLEAPPRSCSRGSTTSPATRSMPSWRDRCLARGAATARLGARCRILDSRTGLRNNVMTIAPQSLAGLSLAEKRMLLAELLREKAEPVRRRLPALARPARALVPLPDGSARARRTTSATRRGSGRRSTWRRSAGPCRR